MFSSVGAGILVEYFTATLQKQNCSFNKDLCHVSCTCVTMSILYSHVLHNHNISLSYGHSKAHNSCDDIVVYESTFLHISATHMTKVFVKGTMSFLLCTIWINNTVFYGFCTHCVLTVVQIRMSLRGLIVRKGCAH